MFRAPGSAACRQRRAPCSASGRSRARRLLPGRAADVTRIERNEFVELEREYSRAHAGIVRDLGCARRLPIRCAAQSCPCPRSARPSRCASASRRRFRFWPCSRKAVCSPGGLPASQAGPSEKITRYNRSRGAAAAGGGSPPCCAAAKMGIESSIPPTSRRRANTPTRRRACPNVATGAAACRRPVRASTGSSSGSSSPARARRSSRPPRLRAFASPYSSASFSSYLSKNASNCSAPTVPSAIQRVLARHRTRAGSRRAAAAPVPTPRARPAPDRRRCGRRSSGSPARRTSREASAGSG